MQSTFAFAPRVAKYGSPAADHTFSACPIVCLQAAFERSGRNATVSGLLCTIGFVAALTMEVFAGPMDDTVGESSLSSASI